MPLTPIDVQQKTFGTALRGYDLDEVDDFLDDVVTALRDYEQRLRDAQDRIAVLERDVSSRGSEESAISRALVAAQKSADTLVEEAKSEADQILAGARTEAERLTSEHDDERRKLTDEVNAMRAAVNQVRARVREVMSSLGGDLEMLSGEVDVADERVSSGWAPEQVAYAAGTTDPSAEADAPEEAEFEVLAPIDAGYEADDPSRDKAVTLDLTEAEAPIDEPEPRDDWGEGGHSTRPWERD